jgi:hypothetical protein
MLPEARQSDYLYPVPKFDLKQNDVDDFTNELKGFHEQFGGCFLRSESRSNFFRYMAGQFSQIERKSIEPIRHCRRGWKSQSDAAVCKRCALG